MWCDHSMNLQELRSGTTGDDQLIDDVHAVAAHYGVADADITLPAAQGQVNLTVFLGRDLVLRLPRTERAEALMTKEAEAIGLAESAGVPTPALIDLDASRRIGSVPYEVLERVDGVTLASCWSDAPRRARALGALGEVLHALHEVKSSQFTHRTDAIPAPYSFSPSEVLDDLVAAGEIGGQQRAWLLEQFDALRPEGPSQDDPVLVHRDVNPSNVMVAGDGTTIALVDWGCAEWGNPARDLVGVPIGALPALLSGYCSAAGDPPSDDGSTLERDALWYRLYLALARLLKSPPAAGAGPGAQDWAAPRTATLLDLFAFVAGEGAKSWPTKLRGLSQC